MAAGWEQWIRRGRLPSFALSIMFDPLRGNDFSGPSFPVAVPKLGAVPEAPANKRGLEHTTEGISQN